MSIALLSFFTGGGFLDIGFESAGFRVVWTNENDPAVAELYSHGMTAWYRATGKWDRKAAITNQNSITDLTAGGIQLEVFPSKDPVFFGVMGGPPCSDFSLGGRNGGSQGKHGRLTTTFVNLICQLQPHFFVIENVPGLVRHRSHRIYVHRIIKQLEEAGRYAVDHRILSALELGVPQNRNRLFIVGIKRRIAMCSLHKRVGTGDRGWFPWPEDPRYTNALELPWPDLNDFGGKPRRPEGIPAELTVYPLLYRHPRPDRLPNGEDVFTPHSEQFWQRREGDVSSQSFKRLHRHRYSPTAWYGNNEVHLHPSKPRRLSVREALRIQTVPDTYILPEDGSLTTKFKVVCNGVPCRMAEKLARALLSFLEAAGIESNACDRCTPLE